MSDMFRPNVNFGQMWNQMNTFNNHTQHGFLSQLSTTNMLEQIQSKQYNWIKTILITSF